MKIMKSRIFRIIISFALLTAITVNAAARGRSANYSKPVGFDISELNIPDGTYTGEAIGFRPGLEVEVVVENGEIVEITITDHNEVGPQYYARPIKYIPKAIIEEQNTEVDAVSGATATSKAIMAAVENALGLDEEEE